MGKKGGIVETTKKKKKGRPSLLDLQKRNLKEQQHLLQQFHHRNNSNSAPRSNPNSTPAPPSTNHLRRSTRRNPNPDDEDPDDSDGNDGREKKLKLVVKLPKSSANSADSGGSENDESVKKRKINAIGDGSGLAHPTKGDKSIPVSNPSSSTVQGVAKLDSGPSTPLPDTQLLLFVLERLQKKDTYGVFSEPVDPQELPDYHEVIDNPMDFGTVKKKLTSGVYASLEQFEDDIYLICSNAMQYNAPDTIYFRQARSIHELAKKNFENLRQDSDDNEPEPKVVRRGRPPTKNLKKPLGRPSLERVGSEFSDATLATGAENAILSNHDRSRNNDVYTSWLADNKFERNDDLTGSMLRGTSKTGRKQFVFDENRRNTYLQSQPSANGRESTVLTTFDGERKQLMPVGLQSDGYARSLARFAANLGPVAWRIAAHRIQRSLPAGVKFGPGWVGENDVAPHRSLVLVSSSKERPFSPQSLPNRANSSSAATSCSIESNKDKLLEKPSGHNLSDKRPSISSGSDDHPNSPPPLSAATSSDPSVANRSPEPLTGKGETVEGSNSRGGSNMMDSKLGGIRPGPPPQIQRTPEIQPGTNGLNGTYGLNRPAQIAKQVGMTKSGGFSFHSSQMLDQVSRTNTKLTHPGTSNSLNSEETKPSENPGTIQFSGSYSNSVNESLPAQTSGVHPQSSRQGSSQQIKPKQKPDSVPPDLNVRFQSPGSPSSSRADSTQPDLALQL
ncbi:hypothetical protein ACLB2K_011145 [Fragaria x ananassa]